MKNRITFYGLYLVTQKQITMSIKNLYFIMFLALTAVLTTSCDDSDPCKDAACGDNGTCIEGTCVCNVGYEGTACAEEWVTKFLGSYTGSAGCGYNLTKPAIITRLSATSINIANFAGFDVDAVANVSLESTSSVSAEVLSVNNYIDTAGRKFSGTGKISGNTISFAYTVIYSDNTSETCTFNITK